jgi:hypothetical protein
MYSANRRTTFALDRIRLSIRSPGYSGTLPEPRIWQVIFDEGAVQGEYQAAIHDLWSGMTRGYALGYLGLTHTFEHLSDVGIIRALWGHPGRWSPSTAISATARSV